MDQLALASPLHFTNRCCLAGHYYYCYCYLTRYQIHPDHSDLANRLVVPDFNFHFASSVDYFGFNYSANFSHHLSYLANYFLTNLYCFLLMRFVLNHYLVDCLVVGCCFAPPNHSPHPPAPPPAPQPPPPPAYPMALAFLSFLHLLKTRRFCINRRFLVRCILH